MDADFRRGERLRPLLRDPRQLGAGGRQPEPGHAREGALYARCKLPGAMGTKGGPKTDENGRVLLAEGGVVPGLYAVGNAAASVGGPGYPGAGITIGASMTFGYLAAKHAVGRS
ncbi:MAG: FAD-binding protein [Sandaracinaceae bacterium]|nr:FAD-binding protein [Sandaracinaceae bacterium]